ncbi:hypothetical protein L7E55_08420 [Pelotomaculum isophthalicicum JI]|uniref:Uncharacterized protein n=1 Tax=Pelotomaculum isophthalicicum JI TaxID=947010 RepID=A0A9X4JU23_9FIRM|nr:hypothetical protein [Pelotomaculum isophthalicicum]MDF9408380.1 hypothetical protein [Pelotomaculum isophthalicicum JI]
MKALAYGMEECEFWAESEKRKEFVIPLFYWLTENWSLKEIWRESVKPAGCRGRPFLIALIKSWRT